MTSLSFFFFPSSYAYVHIGGFCIIYLFSEFFFVQYTLLTLLQSFSFFVSSFDVISIDIYAIINYMVLHGYFSCSNVQMQDH